MASKKVVVAFDLYGTLLSTESIGKELAKHFGDGKADAIAATWRKYQLEYTWRLNSMGQVQSFSDVTRSSLRHALEENSVSLDDSQIADLMKAYDSLSTFSDVQPALKEIQSRKDTIAPFVFSNGTQSMVTNCVKSSPDLGPYANTFDGIVTVETTSKFKPAPEVYYHLAKEAGKGTDPESMSEMWLVSGNPFDVVGARAVGMKAAWVDRKGHHSAGTGWTDRLVDRENGPTVVIKGLDEVLKAIEKHM